MLSKHGLYALLDPVQDCLQAALEPGLWALRELDLDVPAGTVLGLLGHNGAGKTTAIRLLKTLSTPTEGSAAVAGHDVVAAPTLVRADIGVAG